MFCKKCGNQVEENAKFCTKCGNTMEGINQTPIQSTPPVVNTPPKKSGGTGLIIGLIIAFVAVIGVVALIMGAAMFIIPSLVYETEEKTTQIKEIKEIKATMYAQDMSVKYDTSKWKIMNVTSTAKTEGVTKGLSYGDYRIVLVYEKESEIFSTYSFKSGLLSQYKSAGYTITNSSDTYSINGKTWYSLTYIDREQKYLQLIYADGYNTYSITYLSLGSKFDEGLPYAKEVMNTVKIGY